MSRTKRGVSEQTDIVHTAMPYRRAERRKMLKEFEREYRGRNQNPLIEL